MNPFHLDATGLMVWGLVAHLMADWPLQNEWLAKHKSERRKFGVPLWDRHSAAYVHAGVHALLLAPVFGVVAVPLAIAHLLIDTRTPVVWWSRLVRQTQPSGERYDVGLEVRFWTDQVFHIATLAIAALAAA